MATVKYVVEKKVDGEWVWEGVWTDPAKLAVATWEMGLNRPDWEEIRVTTVEEKGGDKMQFHGDEALLEFLMKKHGVSRTVAMIAMNHNSLSVIYASDALSNDICRYQYEREARECGLE